MNERALFLSALDIPDPAARAAYLDAACGPNADLRRGVEELLDALARAGSFLAGPAATGEYTPSPEPDEPGPAEGPGLVLAGRYKLLEALGEGGMGSVWMAQQTEPVKRLVAVKLIKAGMDSRAVLARFEAERQALALMDHPNIAKVLDGGLTPDGRPFFVMELVKGVPITQYCDQRKLTPRERLELFVPVCQAVQHAHTKGIIHRDLKPSNVLVALYDDKPVPKVIDFGVAKAAGQPLTDRTLVTGFGAVVGTPEYMSPEQASFNNLDIDTRSDVYALGVLLYELLTGTPPHPRGELQQAGLLEMLRVVREVDPPRPSQRLSQTRNAKAGSRNSAVSHSEFPVPSFYELDWIVMKALEKDRARRYETAAGFAQDVGRYLAGEAVQAVPPSRGYRLRKFARRNRAALLTVTAFIAVLVATTAVSIVMAVWARQAERQSERALKVATENVDFLRRDLLEQAAPDGERVHDPNVTLRTVLDRAAARLDGRFPDQPLVEAILRYTVGETYQGLGEYALARPHLERSAELFESVNGPADLNTQVVRKQLGHVYIHLEDYAAAERVLAAVADLDGQPSWEADTARQTAAADLATVYRHQGRMAESEALFRRVIEARRRTHGPDGSATLNTMNSLALMLNAAGRHAEEEAVLREVLAGRRKALGDGHLKTAQTKWNLWLALRSQGKEAEEMGLLREAAEVILRTQGEHPNAAWTYYTYAQQFCVDGPDPAAAQPYILAALRTVRRHPGCLTSDPHLKVGLWIGNRLANHKKWDLAVPVYREWLAATLSATPEEVMNEAEVETWLGYWLATKDDPTAAEPLLLQGYRRLEGLDPSKRRDKLLEEAAKWLAWFYDVTGRPEYAGKWRIVSKQWAPPVEPGPAPRVVK